MFYSTGFPVLTSSGATYLIVIKDKKGLIVISLFIHRLEELQQTDDRDENYMKREGRRCILWRLEHGTIVVSPIYTPCFSTARFYTFFCAKVKTKYVRLARELCVCIMFIAVSFLQCCYACINSHIIVI